MGETRFFALKEDLVPILNAIERKGALRYSLAGRFLEPRIMTYSSAAEIPNLCITTCESAVGCNRYLVCEPSISLVLDPVTETDRDNKPIRKSYHLNQGHNPDTIVFGPGGLWKGEILLYGLVSSLPWVNEVAKKILKRFQSAIRKGFTRVHGCYVGREAHEMLRAGRRLTTAEQSPREFDLTLP